MLLHKLGESLHDKANNDREDISGIIGLVPSIPIFNNRFGTYFLWNNTTLIATSDFNDKEITSLTLAFRYKMFLKDLPFS